MDDETQRMDTYCVDKIPWKLSLFRFCVRFCVLVLIWRERENELFGLWCEWMDINAREREERERLCIVHQTFAPKKKQDLTQVDR